MGQAGSEKHGGHPSLTIGILHLALFRTQLVRRGCQFGPTPFGSSKSTEILSTQPRLFRQRVVY